MQRSKSQGAEALNGENKNRKEKIETQIGKNINIKYSSVMNKMTNKLKIIIAKDTCKFPSSTVGWETFNMQGV